MEGAVNLSLVVVARHTPSPADVAPSGPNPALERYSLGRNPHLPFAPNPVLPRRSLAGGHSSEN